MCARVREHSGAKMMRSHDIEHDNKARKARERALEQKRDHALLTTHTHTHTKSSDTWTHRFVVDLESPY